MKGCGGQEGESGDHGPTEVAATCLRTMCREEAIEEEEEEEENLTNSIFFVDEKQRKPQK